MIMIIDTDHFTVDDTATLNKALSMAFSSVECGPQSCKECEHYNACVVLKRLRDWASDRELWRRIEQEDSWKQKGKHNV